MPNLNKESFSDSREPINTLEEIEGSKMPRESMLARLRELGEQAQLMGDDVALDARSMTPEQLETQQEWVEASQRAEAEDAFALMQGEKIDIGTKTPLEILLAKESLDNDEEELKN